MVGARPAPAGLWGGLSSFSPGPSGRSLGHNYTEVRSIGRGSFGEATLAKDSNGNHVVMKTIDIAKLDKEQQGDAVNEVKVLSSLKHPYIVRYHESFVENGTLAIVMDYADGGDLSRRISRHRDKQQLFSEGQILRWFTQVALGLKYLHNRHILHRDLKPQNIFLTKQDDLRLGDFGISKTLASSTLKEETTIGTPYYFSPEICLEKLYSFASDIWALGCILYELAALHVPFEAQNIPGLIRKITAARVPSMPPVFSNEMRQLVHELLSRDYSRRPSAVEILQGPMIQAEMRTMLGDTKFGSDAGSSPPLSQSGTRKIDVDSRRMLGSLLKPLAANMDMKRSPSAPVPSPAGRKKNVLQSSGTNCLNSSTGALKTAWPTEPEVSKKTAWAAWSPPEGDKRKGSKASEQGPLGGCEKISRDFMNGDGPLKLGGCDKAEQRDPRVGRDGPLKLGPLITGDGQMNGDGPLKLGGCDKVGRDLMNGDGPLNLANCAAKLSRDFMNGNTPVKRACASPLLGKIPHSRCGSRGGHGHGGRPSRRRPALPVWQDIP